MRSTGSRRKPVLLILRSTDGSAGRHQQKPGWFWPVHGNAGLTTLKQTDLNSSSMIKDFVASFKRSQLHDPAVYCLGRSIPDAHQHVPASSTSFVLRFTLLSVSYNLWSGRGFVYWHVLFWVSLVLAILRCNHKETHLRYCRRYCFTVLLVDTRYLCWESTTESVLKQA